MFRVLSFYFPVYGKIFSLGGKEVSFWLQCETIIMISFIAENLSGMTVCVCVCVLLIHKETEHCYSIAF